MKRSFTQYCGAAWLRCFFCRCRCLSITRTRSQLFLWIKISRDILKKMADGRGGDFVRVIIQPSGQPDLTLDTTLEYSGGSNIKKFKNYGVRVVTCRYKPPSPSRTGATSHTFL